VTSIVLALLFYSASPVTSQTPTPASATEVVKIDVALVEIDALVLQKNSARIVGGLNKEDFLLYEDGIKQQVTHFSQDQLPREYSVYASDLSGRTTA
jgi:hypothetical protein